MLKINCALQTIQRNIDRAELCANRHCPNYDKTHPLWMKVSELETKLSLLESQLQILINKYSQYRRNCGKYFRKKSIPMEIWT
jgi:hypothetical protein